MVSQLKLSADGHTLAYLARRCGAPVINLNVVNLTSGQHRQWSVPRLFYLSRLSLSGDGAKLTFSTAAVNGVSNVVCLLDTSSAPGPIKERSQILVRGTSRTVRRHGQPQKRESHRAAVVVL